MRIVRIFGLWNKSNAMKLLGLGIFVLAIMTGCGQKPKMPETRIVIGNCQTDSQSFLFVFIFDVYALSQSKPSIETDLRHYWDVTKIKPLKNIDIEKIIANHEIEEFGRYGVELSLNNFLLHCGIPACGFIFSVPNLPDGLDEGIKFNPYRGDIVVHNRKCIRLRHLLNGKVYEYDNTSNKVIETNRSVSQYYAACLRQCYKRAVEAHMKGDKESSLNILTGHGVTTRIISCKFDQEILSLSNECPYPENKKSND